MTYNPIEHMTASDKQREIERRARDLWAREGGACVSGLISTLAGGYGNINANDRHAMRQAGEAIANLSELTEQATELASPVLDYEEAAREAGWAPFDGVGGVKAWHKPNPDEPEAPFFAPSAQDACEGEDVEPHEWEVFEHWIVSDWLGSKLEAHGEKVDHDFAGLTIWARTTTGQAIYADGVMERIAEEMILA